MQRRNKFNAIHTEVDGIKFDSKAEARRYKVLKAMECDGKIKDLQLQPEFELVPHYKSPANGRMVRAIKYRADFQYIEGGQIVVEDVKGRKTDVYKLKKKLFEYRYGMPIREVK